MSFHMLRQSRRGFLGSLAAGGAFFTTRGLFADELARTPELTEGPFYPDKLPLDTDNDLLIVNDSITPAVGEITHLTGRVLDASGSPVRERDRSRSGSATPTGSTCTRPTATGKQDQQDKNFQGFGRFTTGSTRRVLLPHDQAGAVPRRPAPHIHFKVKKGTESCSPRRSTSTATPATKWTALSPRRAGCSSASCTMADFKPMKGSKIGEWTAHHLIVLGRTPDERSFQRS